MIRVMKKKLLLTLSMVAVMSGCVSDTSVLNENENENEKKLTWLEIADPQVDAELALSRGDFRLMALPLRNRVIPGIELDQSQNYALKCGVKLMPGITDAIKGEEHRQQMKQAHEYALAYNTIIKTRCNP